MVLDKTVREILMREGVVPISAKGFYDHFANGVHSQRMYDDVNFIRGVEIVAEIDKLIEANDDSVNRYVKALFTIFSPPITKITIFSASGYWCFVLSLPSIVKINLENKKLEIWKSGTKQKR